MGGDETRRLSPPLHHLHAHENFLPYPQNEQVDERRNGNEVQERRQQTEGVMSGREARLQVKVRRLIALDDDLLIGVVGKAAWRICVHIEGQLVRFILAIK